MSARQYGWSRAAGGRARTLRELSRDTQQALQYVADVITIEPEVYAAVQEVSRQVQRSTALVVLGRSGTARSRLLHCLLGRRLLPDTMPRGCRWIRIQYGSRTQVHLSLGNSEFELVEELECNKRPWDVLPEEDLVRRDITELSTILEVELNNQFLKDGIQIIIPPDLPAPATCDHLQLKSTHAEWYAKRSAILKNFCCVYLYAVDKMGKNVFSDNIYCENSNLTRSDGDLWSIFNLYTSVQPACDTECRSDRCDSDTLIQRENDRTVWIQPSGEPAVLNSENCLDLYQLKATSPAAQPLFVLFADARELPAAESAESADMTESADMAESAERAQSETTESAQAELPEADREMYLTCRHSPVSPECKEGSDSETQRLSHEQMVFMNELVDQWEMMTNPPRKHHVKSQWAIVNDTEVLGTPPHKLSPPYTPQGRGAADETCGKRRHDKVVRTRSGLLSAVVKFATQTVNTYHLEASTKLSEIHVKLVQKFILASFELERELQIVPKKIQFIATHELHLFETINETFKQGEKRQELVQTMKEVLAELHQDIFAMDWSVDDFPGHRDPRFSLSHSLVSYMSVSLAPPLSDGEEAETCEMYNMDDYEIIDYNDDSYSDCLTRGSELSQCGSIPVATDSGSFSAAQLSQWSGRCSTNISVKHATIDVQQTVLSILSRKISQRLVKVFDCLKESYFGTLQRCIESLEGACGAELGGAPASAAVRQLLAAAAAVALPLELAASLRRSLLLALRRVLRKLRIVSDEADEGCCPLSGAWRRRAALDAARALDPHSLARVVSARVSERLCTAHARWTAALGALEAALTRKLHSAQDAKLNIRKKYAPLFARLCLESTSMCDLLMYGAPELGREIGRGQYGVVYGARGRWAGRCPGAVKSVVPADDRHYHELAMEFFYTRSIPPHPRIVPLYGSIVQRSGARCVLLVTARYVRDLHAAVRAGLTERERLIVALDIVEGLRYLHSLGLVHRDVKLKNVLLDAANRAALADLGFCAAGALLSGSLVGTPVHMAPELLRRRYGGAVDVYAFGILFWYLCAGDVKLPAAFESFSNKDQLWTRVSKGLRPERLPHFTDECWSLMQACWHNDPSQRPLLGDVHQQLQSILAQTIADDKQPYVKPSTDDSNLNSAREFEL